ncbi:hypothetical protein Emag_007258 [Eimeria magna]
MSTGFFVKEEGSHGRKKGRFRILVDGITQDGEDDETQGRPAAPSGSADLAQSLLQTSPQQSHQASPQVAPQPPEPPPADAETALVGYEDPGDMVHSFPAIPGEETKRLGWPDIHVTFTPRET